MASIFHLNVLLARRFVGGPINIFLILYWHYTGNILSFKQNSLNGRVVICQSY